MISGQTVSQTELDPLEDYVELNIGGMTCSACAGNIERRLNKLEGVTATVNFATERALVTGIRPAEADRAYGTLAAYVTRHVIAVDGPIREYYPVGPHETPDSTQWRTEIGWPIFRTGSA